MKKLFFLSIISLLFIGCEKQSILTGDKIPSEIAQYVNTHFPNNPIVQVIEDKDGVELEYEVNLKDGFLLKFNRKKEIKDIESSGAKLPDSVIPAKIINYVTATYPENIIIGWELDDRNQKIKLNNQLELEFTMSGEFLRIDN